MILALDDADREVGAPGLPEFQVREHNRAITGSVCPPDLPVPVSEVELCYVGTLELDTLRLDLLLYNRKIPSFTIFDINI